MSELVTAMAESLQPSEVAKLRIAGSRDEFLDERRETIAEFLREVTGAFHISTANHLPNQLHDSKNDYLFSRNFDEINAAAANLPADTKNQLLRAYGSLWVHSRAWEFVRTGAWPKFLEELYISPRVDDLESLADKYLREKGLSSPTLEWVLINALVYLTIVDYTTTAYFSWRLPGLISGQSVKGPLLGIDYLVAMNKEDTSWKGVLAKVVGAGIGRIIGSVITLVLSGIFAYLITFWTNNPLITWMVFTASAASTWIIMGLKNHRDEHEDNDRKAKAIIINLLWDLSSSHERLARSDFHVGNVRHLLYRLEREIFHLDRWCSTFSIGARPGRHLPDSWTIGAVILDLPLRLADRYRWLRPCDL